MRRIVSLISCLVIILLLVACDKEEVDIIRFMEGDELTIEVGTPFSNVMAFCVDAEIGCELSIVDDDLDITTVGSYAVTYQAILNDKVIAEKDRIINVVDSTVPVINVEPEENIILELGSEFSIPKAVCSDNYDNYCEVTATGTVNTTEVGEYKLIYTSIDKSGNENQLELVVFIKDSVKPVVTLNGDKVTYVILGDDYDELGATCLDNEKECDVTIIGEVDTSVVGTTIVQYEYTDASGNTGKVERDVIVRELVSPVITLNGVSTKTITVGSSYTELGAMCTDNYDTECSVEINGEVNENTLGTYSIIYRAIDSSGNVTEVVRTVQVTNPSSGGSSGSSGGSSSGGSSRDYTSPVISLNGSQDIILEVGEEYIDLGATCTDNKDATCNVTSTSNIDINSVGLYQVKYNATDSEGNIAQELIRNVRVITIPSITRTYINLERKIIAIDGSTGDNLGGSVSINGNYIVVGARSDDYNGDDSGSVYVYKINDETYERKITARDGSWDDYFGGTVSIDGNYIVVGSYGDDSSTGSLYVYKLDDESYERKITASDGITSDYFGISVSIDGNYIVVGAHSDESGSAYVYKIDDETYERKINASDGNLDDSFGNSVSIDGNYIVVGSHRDDSDTGSLYVYKIDDETYERKIIPSDGVAYDYFGYSGAIDGNYIVVGAYYDDDNGINSGSVYVYKIDDESYERKITASDGEQGDSFGYSASIDGNYIVVGAYYDDDNGFNSGSIYIYKTYDETYENKITASDGVTSDSFGKSVSINDSAIVVGAHYDDDNGADSGSVYYFLGDRYLVNVDEINTDTVTITKDGSSYTSGLTIMSPGLYEIEIVDKAGNSSQYSFNADFEGPTILNSDSTTNQTSLTITTDEDFIEISSDYGVTWTTVTATSSYLLDELVEGTYGIVVKDALGDKSDTCEVTVDTTSPVLSVSKISSNTYEKKITASDGLADDFFGISVSVSGNFVVVGARSDDDNGTDSGSVYVYKLDDTGYERKITASDGLANDFFGISVSVSGNFVIVGARSDDDNGTDSGSVYVYKLDDTGYERKITASDGLANDFFGISVSVSGNFVVVGAYGDDDSGSLYVYKLDDTDYERKITASDGAPDDFFGYSVSVSGNSVVVGARLDDDNGTDSGSVYVYKLDDIDYERKITASDGTTGDWFSDSVSVSGNHVVVGAILDDDNGFNSGSIYVYKLDDTDYERKITASDGTTGDWFSNSVSISGNYVVVGACLDADNGADSGSVYLYKLDDTDYERKITASDGTADDYFGISVSVSGNHVIVGARLDDDNGSDSGSIYGYSLEGAYDISIDEANIDTLTITKDGINYASGLTIMSPGLYEIEIVDKAGNSTQYSFNADFEGPTILNSDSTTNQIGLTITTDEDFIEISIDYGVTWTTVTATSSYLVTGLTDGIYGFMVKDEIGDKSDVYELEVDSNS
ncbi:DUF5011 domain-containing protein [Mycoplasmatota bacterium zrk1]